jgi:small basic protein (TIGR04137 family)
VSATVFKVGDATASDACSNPQIRAIRRYFSSIKVSQGHSVEQGVGRWRGSRPIGAGPFAQLKAARTIAYIVLARTTGKVLFRGTKRSATDERSPAGDGRPSTGDPDVTIDKSLRRKGRLARARNVLKRDERIAQLQTEERWPPGRSVLGLPKVRIIKTAVGKKKKKKTAEEADTTAAAAEATPAAAGKGAPAKAAGASKAAAPAKPASGKK